MTIRANTILLRRPSSWNMVSLNKNSPPGNRWGIKNDTVQMEFTSVFFIAL